jgi:dipeptidyl aminopeptidase/acylaminoacyl peptidase
MKSSYVRFPARAFLCLLILLAFAVAVRAEEPRFPTSEDLRHIKAIGDPGLSPDGKQVLFSLTDATADGARSHVWVVGVEGGSARQLTYSPAADKRGEHGAVWSPDGGAIFFLAKRGETAQLFRLPMAGGEAMAYDLKVVPMVDDSKEKGAIPPAKADAEVENAKPEPLAINVSGFEVSPDGKWLAVWASDPETPGEKKAKEAKADAVWMNHERHGERLYLGALKADGALDGALKPVGVAPDVRAVSWSPQSDRLVVMTEPPNDVSDLGPAMKGWLVATGTLDKPVALTGLPATVRGGFAWKPDGTAMVFAAQTPEDAPPGVEELYALGILGEARPVRLMAGFKGGLGGGLAVWMADGTVLAPVAEGTRVGAARLAVDGKAAPVELAMGAPVVTSFGTNRGQTGWIWLAEGSGQPRRLCFAAKPGGDCRVLATPELGPQRFKAVKSQLLHWESDGLTIEGLLYLPPEATTGKVPLIVDVHGGPLGEWTDRYDEWTEFLVGHGWAVLRPNPRGSSSYGVKFAAANKNDLGGGDFRDVMSGVDAVLKGFPIDPAKLALMGYSYGGEMAGFAEGKTDRFKAIISGAPVIDQFSEYGTERGSWYDRWYFGKPWERFEDAWRQSPLAGAAKAKTPFLLLQGEDDSTDPLGQALEMYRALRQEGVPVELVTYPREDHGPLARGIFGYPVAEPWHGFDGRQRIVEFLNKAFGASQAASDEAKADLPAEVKASAPKMTAVTPTAEPVQLPSAELKKSMTKLDAAAGRFKSAQADIVWENVQTAPVQDTDTQLGTAVFQRKAGQISAALHISSDNDRPVAKDIVYAEGTLKFYDPMQNRLSVFKAEANRAAFESLLTLGFGASGAEMEKSWVVTQTGSDVVGGVKATKFELLPRDQGVRKSVAKATLWMDLERGVALKQRFDDPSGNYREVTYKSLKVNKSVPEDSFEIKTAPGTVVQNH